MMIDIRDVPTVCFTSNRLHSHVVAILWSFASVGSLRNILMITLQQLKSRHKKTKKKKMKDILYMGTGPNLHQSLDRHQH